jgi:hypothetical protein
MHRQAADPWCGLAARTQSRFGYGTNAALCRAGYSGRRPTNIDFPHVHAPDWMDFPQSIPALRLVGQARSVGAGGMDGK